MKTRPRIEVSYVLVALAPLLLLALWPSSRNPTPHPASTGTPPRFVYVQHADTLMDPTVIAAPGAYLEFGKETQQGADEPRARPATGALLDATLGRPTARANPTPPPPRPLTERAAAALPGPFRATIARPRAKIGPSGDGIAAGLTVQPLGILADASPEASALPPNGLGKTSWSVLASVSITADGRVVDAAIQPPAPDGAPVQTLSAFLHRLRFQPAAGPREGQVRLTYRAASE